MTSPELVERLQATEAVARDVELLASRYFAIRPRIRRTTVADGRLDGYAERHLHAWNALAWLLPVEALAGR